MASGEEVFQCIYKRWKKLNKKREREREKGETNLNAGNRLV